MRIVPVVVLAAGLAGCTCIDGGTGGGTGGSSGKTSISYDLIEMTGEFNVSGVTSQTQCQPSIWLEHPGIAGLGREEHEEAKE